MADSGDGTDLPIISGPVEQTLSERELVAYRDFKSDLLQWLLHLGKDPEHAEGYASATVRQVSYKVDTFYRWIWERDDQYTIAADTKDADEFMMSLICSEEDYSTAHLSTSQKCLKRLFKWRRHQRGEEVEWEPDQSFSHDLSQPRDFLTTDERTEVREATLEYGSIPSYSSLSSEQRDKWRIHLAQRFEKPKSEVTPDDWNRANGWKIPSLVWTSLDTGLRPIEVDRATVEWIDTSNSVLRIPKGESSKNTDNWIVSVTDRTASALDRWLDEREQYSAYDDTDALWLTQRGNAYNSSSLRYMLHQLCEIAEIPYENRQMSWYSIRHSVGTYMTREEDLAAAQAQLRHKTSETTMRYDQAPVADRRDAPDRME